jgi:hypothetical protein
VIKNSWTPLFSLYIPIPWRHRKNITADKSAEYEVYVGMRKNSIRAKNDFVAWNLRNGHLFLLRLNSPLIRQKIQTSNFGKL